MALKRIFTIALFLFEIGCGGAGTEVVSPPNPNEGPGPQSIETDFYAVSLNLPAGWSFTEYGPGAEIDDGVFADADPETITAAHLAKEPSRFTFFFSYLDRNELLVDYVRQRRPTGDLQITEQDFGRSLATGILFMQEEPGPRGGFLFDFYVESEGAVLWMRAEFVGTDEEKNRTLDEFNAIIESVEFVPKRRTP